MQAIRTDEITGLWSYLASIDWSEPWFLGVAVFHILCAAATYLTCRHLTVQGALFAIFLVLVGCSEYINQFAAGHWKKFSRQQYFDSNGLFISVIFSVPILINCLVIVVLWLKTSADLMSGIRRKQLQRQSQQQENAAVSDGDAKTGQTSDLPDSDEVAADTKKDK